MPEAALESLAEADFTLADRYWDARANEWRASSSGGRRRWPTRFLRCRPPNL
jgi:hypothetical protein